MHITTALYSTLHYNRSIASRGIISNHPLFSFYMSRCVLFNILQYVTGMVILIIENFHPSVYNTISIYYNIN